MKGKNDPWLRLARAARCADDPPRAPMPFAFDSRVLEALQNAVDETPVEIWQFQWILRGAVLCATMILIAVVAMNWDALGDENVKDLVLFNSNSLLQMAVSP